MCPLSELGWCGRVRVRGDTNIAQEDTGIRNCRDDTGAGAVLRVGEIGNIDQVIVNGRLSWEALW